MVILLVGSLATLNYKPYTMEALAAEATNSSRFEKFTILTTTYKTVHNHAISVDVLYPKSLDEPSSQQLCSIPRPILLRYHGGGLIAGYSLFAPFFNPWYLELAEKYSAIIVSPNYRLLPEASVLNVLEDVEDHWQWMHQSLPGFLQHQKKGNIQADLARIFTAGDSAGGYLSLQMGLSHPTEIRAVNAVYPMVNPKAPYFSNGQQRSVFNIPSLPKDTMERYLESVQRHTSPNPVIPSAEAGIDRLRLMFALTQHAQIGQLFPTDTMIPHPLERLEAGARFPRGGVLVLHGRDDTVSPVEESCLLMSKVTEVDPSLNFRLVIRDGEHGFDHSAKLQDEWLWDAVQDVLKAWLE